MKSSHIGLIVLVLIVVAGAFMFLNNNESEDVTNDVMEKTEDSALLQDNNFDALEEKDKMMMADSVAADDAMMKLDDNKMMAMKDKTYSYSGDLVDVSGGVAVGSAMANFSNASDEGYMLYATFDGLPDPENGFFYEGWVVRRGDDFSVLSTGELDNVNGEYSNSYASSTDLTDHTFYVLTLEPDDGDPAPAEHILEGVMVSPETMIKDNTGDETDDKMEK